MLFCNWKQFCFELSETLIVTFQEYVDYYGSAGVQHIALNTSDIISAVSDAVTPYTPTNTTANKALDYLVQH